MGYTYPGELTSNLPSIGQGPLSFAHNANKSARTQPDIGYTYQRYPEESTSNLSPINQGPVSDAYKNSLVNGSSWDPLSSTDSLGTERAEKKLSKTKPWGLLSGLRGGLLRKSDTEVIMESTDPLPLLQHPPAPPFPPKRNTSARRNRSNVQAKKKEQQNPSGGLHNPGILRTVQGLPIMRHA